jgi:hypothetical protein
MYPPVSSRLFQLKELGLPQRKRRGSKTISIKMREQDTKDKDK